jgi:diacylglycerol O-acyltransferase/trehalose O-mycolyltransferase
MAAILMLPAVAALAGGSPSATAFSHAGLFRQRNEQAGGQIASFDFPPAGNHSRPCWGAQPHALKPDLIATILK